MTAAAAVRTQDEVGCLESEELDLEVRLALSDEIVERLDLFVRLSGDDPHELTLRVTDQGRLLWSKTTEVAREDCALVPSLVARSLEPALSAIPGWQLQAWRRHQRPELALVATGSLPAAARLGASARALLPLAGVLWWGGDLEGSWSLVEHHESGDLQIATPGLATGPTLRVPVGADAIQLHARASLGPAVVVGRGFLADAVNVAPRVAAAGEVTFASRAWLRVGIRAEVPIVRLAPTFQDTGEAAPEAPFRLGMILGVGGPLRESEGDGAERG